MVHQSNLVNINLDLSNNFAHMFNVTMNLETATKNQRLSMPCWTPGSYMIREFAQHIVSFSAYEDAKPIKARKTSKNCFELENLGPKVTIKYQVYAFDSSIRAAFLDDQQGYFNGTALFMRPHGFEGASYTLTILRPTAPSCASWQVASAMDAVDVDEAGFGCYRALGYEALIDYPFQISAMKRLSFVAAETPHEMVLVGDVRAFDEDRLRGDLSKLCQSHIEMFGKAPPFSRYLFIARFEEGGMGGLEHRNSSMLLASPHGLPQPPMLEPDPGYRAFLGLCSHEYFHAWNVKRLMPKNFVALDLDQECYTNLLWLFEGVTSYYDDLMLRRAGLISTESYLEVLSKNYSRLLKVHGRLVQSLAEASFDAWIKFYRPNENSLNTSVSYYLKGSFVALMLDLMIRAKSAGEKSLDDVIARAFQLYGHGLGISEEEFFALLADVGGIEVADFAGRFIHGVEELPLEALLEPFGIEMALSAEEFSLDDKTKIAACLGMKIRIDDHNKAHINFVEQGGPAMMAGLSPHDEVVAVDNIRLDHHTASDLFAALKPGRKTTFLIARRKILKTYEIVPKSPERTSCKFLANRHPSEQQALLRKGFVGL